MAPSAQPLSPPAVVPSPLLAVTFEPDSAGQRYLEKFRQVNSKLQSSAFASRACHQRVAKLTRDGTLQKAERLEAMLQARCCKLTTNAILQLLQCLQAAVQQTLQDASCHHDQFPNAAWNVLHNYAEQADFINSQVESRANLLSHGIFNPVSRRSDMLAQEQVALSALASPSQQADLCAVVKHLRTLETSYAFQRNLAIASCTEAEASRRTQETFAYGSTPFHSWQTITAQVSKEVKQARNTSREMMVWGSSIGWMVFFGALSLGLPSSGFEILDPLHEVAISLQQQLQVQHCHFHLADMLTADLSKVAILLLCSQCWDPQLQDAAIAKILKELRPPAVCIHYSRRLQPLLPTCHELIVETSWSQHQPIFIHQL